MLLPDYFSWNAPELSDEIQLDLSICHVHISPKCKADVQQAVLDDPPLHVLAEIFLHGLPENLKDVPQPPLMLLSLLQNVKS